MRKIITLLLISFFFVGKDKNNLANDDYYQLIIIFFYHLNAKFLYVKNNNIHIGMNHQKVARVNFSGVFFGDYIKSCYLCSRFVT